MNAVALPSTGTWPLRAGQWLFALVAIGLLVNPPLANLGQAGLLALAAGTRIGRQRFAWAMRQPVCLAALAFWLVIALGVTYSAADRHEALSTLWGWRKLVMLPLAMAFLAAPPARLRLVAVFVGGCCVAAAASYVAWSLGLRVPIANADTDVPGIVVRNHSTQSAMFAVGVFAAAACALLGHELSPRARRLYGAAGLFIASNLVLVTTGRTGYVAVLVCMTALAWAWAGERGRSLRWRVSVIALALAATLGALAAAPTSRGRIVEAVKELHGYESQFEVTSMGIRVIFWRNTLPIIARHPLAGWGTGAFEDAYRQQVAGQTGIPALVTRDPHNQYLSITAQHGLLGLAVFLAFIALAFRERPPPGVFRLLGTGVLAAWCTTSLANSHFATFAEGSLLYVWLGAMLAPPPPGDRA